MWAAHEHRDIICGGDRLGLILVLAVNGYRGFIDGAIEHRLEARQPATLLG
jgi:hypothetical protein